MSVIKSTVLILNQYQSKGLMPVSLLQKVLMLLCQYDRILHPFRDSLIPLGTILHSNPLNLQLHMQSTLIWNDKWTEVIPLLEPASLEIIPYTLYMICFPFFVCLHMYSMLPYIWSPLSFRSSSMHTHIWRYISCTYASPRLHTVWTSSLTLRRCRGKAWLCRVNVNVLTPLPKIRALLSPLNPNPLFTVPTSGLATFVLRAAGYLVWSKDLLAQVLRDWSNTSGCDALSVRVLLWGKKTYICNAYNKKCIFGWEPFSPECHVTFLTFLHSIVLD